jgi:hypothetical protein
MNDTPADVAAAFTSLIMQRTEGERAVMAFEMFDLARALMTADLRALHPGITESDLRVQVFQRTYGLSAAPHCEFLTDTAPIAAGRGHRAHMPVGAPRHPPAKARRPRNPSMCQRRATPAGGMDRRRNRVSYSVLMLTPRSQTVLHLAVMPAVEEVDQQAEHQPTQE